MPIALLLSLLLAGGQTEIAHFGNFHVRLNAGSVSQATMVSVKQGDKVLWSAKCDGDEVMAREGANGARFFVLAPPIGFALFKNGGSLVKQVSFSAARDPRPFLYSGSYAVWGDNIFNWTKFDSSNLRWQNQTRKFYAMDFRNGRVKNLPSFRLTGLPLMIVGNELISITPVDWESSVHLRTSRRFWLRRVSLKTGTSSKSPVHLDAQAGKEVFSDIIGWDSWKSTTSQLERGSGNLRISSPNWGRKSVTLKIPRAWIKA